MKDFGQVVDDQRRSVR